MQTLTILYDSQCRFCRRCRLWLEAQPKYLPLRFAGRDSEFARRLWPGIDALGADELAVIGDEGRLYRGDKAWIMCLYALRNWRPLALRLARPGMIHLAGRAFAFISRNRRSVPCALLGTDPESIEAALDRLPPPPSCAVGRAGDGCDLRDQRRMEVRARTHDTGWRQKEKQP